MELDDALVKAELDDIMARIDGIMKKVEIFEGSSREMSPATDEQSAPPFGETDTG